MRVLAVIPARGGSKGVPRKNIKLLGGKPLLQYTAEAALKARHIHRVILSTDDQEIADVGLACGLEVPFLRPSELAKDSTPMLPVVQHAVQWVETHSDYYDAVCLLQPTLPFRMAEDIDACVALLQESAATSVVTVLPVPTQYNPHWVYFQDQARYLHLSTGEDEPIPQRQLLPSAYHRAGSVYVVRRDVIMKQNSLYGDRILGIVVPLDRSVNIDTLDDWASAESLMRSHK